MLEGIDVSSWQGNIDWDKVKASGVSFAIIKATEGTSYVNPRFKKDWQGTKSKGIIRGAYHFFDPTLPAEAQAEHFLSTVQAIEVGDLPAVLDLEGEKWNAIAPHLRMEMVLTWLHRVEKESGLKPVIYTGFYFARDVLRTAGYSELSHYIIWVAHYTKADHPLVPRPWTTWNFWQFTDKAQVAGINGNVDKNRFRGSHEDLLRLTMQKSGSNHAED